MVKIFCEKCRWNLEHFSASKYKIFLRHGQEIPSERQTDEKRPQNEMNTENQRTFRKKNNVDSKDTKEMVDQSNH